MKGNSIEEDIKIVENYLANSAINETDSDFFKEGGWETVDLEIPKSMKHILSDYKRVLKENEQLSTEVNSLKKENEELKEERQIVGIPVRNKRDGKIGIVLHQWESGSVAVLESINPRVINTHDSWNTLEIVTDEVKQTKTKCETIPIKKVKDKIEELEEELEIMKVDNMYGRYKEYGGKTKWERLFATKYGMHDALQELLESEK